MEKKKKLQLQEFAYEIRLALMDEVMHLGFGHLSGSLSIVDLLAVLYGEKLKVRYNEPDWQERDFFVMSKGHAGPALYATLALKGFFPRTWLHSLNKGGTYLPSHCDRTKTPGIDMTAGSLGQGICAACGIALGLKRKGSQQKVYCVVGDGELNEGSCWEAIMFAAHHQLDNLYLIIDRNGKQLDGDTEEILKSFDFAKKLSSFNWAVNDLKAGNDVEAISEALSALETVKEQPKCLVLHTLKGQGYSELAATKLNHHTQLNLESAQAAYEQLAAELAALQAEIQQLGATDKLIAGAVGEDEGNSDEFAKAYIAKIRANMYEVENPAALAEPEFTLAYDDSMQKYENKQNFANQLEKLSAIDDKVIYLDADLINSSGAFKFWQAQPEKVVECGIAEANMIGVAAGLSLVGYKPYCHTFGPFASRRCYDHAFISVAYAGNSVRIFGSDEGVTAAYNGGTHMPFEDLALYRAVPHATVLDIADDVQFRAAMELIKDRKGLTYFRTTRKAFKQIYQEGAKFVIGKANVLKEGKDLTLVACGLMVGEAMAAAEALAEKGYEVGVVDAWSLKPFDNAAILRLAQNTRAIMALENHNIIGGLGDAVAACLAEADVQCKFKKYGVNDEFGQVGLQNYLQEAYKLRSVDIVEAVCKWLPRNRA